MKGKLTLGKVEKSGKKGLFLQLVENLKPSAGNDVQD